MRPKAAVSSFKPSQPFAVGAGLLALDVVFSHEDLKAPRHFAGGTCGNVLTCLSYLGWKSKPVSRLAADPAAALVLSDLKRWSVSTDLISRESTGSTPVIIQNIKRSASGETYHTFSWRCPSCGSHLPGYKPVLSSTAQEIAPRLTGAKVFFFDRVSRGVLVLAQACKDLGALIIFEPSGVGDPSLFREAWRLSHVVKYSHERLRDIADVELERSDREGVLLEIETLGGEGLRLRSRLPGAPVGAWLTLAAFPVEVLRDSAGSGDWCTAGFLDKTARQGLRGFKQLSVAGLTEALRYGQAMAAWNCAFEGARGGMYEVPLTTFQAQVKGILAGSEPQPGTTVRKSEPLARALASLCRSCTDAEPRSQIQKRSPGRR